MPRVEWADLEQQAIQGIDTRSHALPCPFCDPLETAEPIVGQNEHCIAIDLSHDILVDFRIIVPRQHRISPFDLTEEEITATFELLRATKAETDASLSPDGYNSGWNCGSSAGQEVGHTHLHFIARFRYEPLAGKGIRYWIKQEDNRRGGAEERQGQQGYLYFHGLMTWSLEDDKAISTYGWPQRNAKQILGRG